MKLEFPPIGTRIMKSAIAVGLCMLVYFVRTLLPIGNGIPFYGALAALWCMQQYNGTTKNNAVQSSVGTLIGAAYGLVFLLMFRLIGVTVPIIVYISASAVIVPVIYTTVVLNKRNASFFSCVVFLSIALTHSFDSNPYFFVLNRLIRSGVKFTISTVRTPAVLMDIMKGVELQLPVIVMDGAALYDVKEKRYLENGLSSVRCVVRG